MAVNYGGWQAELLIDAGAGLQLDRDPDVAANQLRRFADEPEAIANAGKRARRLAEERFSRDQLADELEQVLKTAVEELH